MDERLFHAWVCVPCSTFNILRQPNPASQYPPSLPPSYILPHNHHRMNKRHPLHSHSLLIISSHRCDVPDISISTIDATAQIASKARRSTVTREPRCRIRGLWYGLKGFVRSTAYTLLPQIPTGNFEEVNKQCDTPPRLRPSHRYSKLTAFPLLFKPPAE